MTTRFHQQGADPEDDEQCRDAEFGGAVEPLGDADSQHDEGDRHHGHTCRMAHSPGHPESGRAAESTDTRRKCGDGGEMIRLEGVAQTHDEADTKRGEQELGHECASGSVVQAAIMACPRARPPSLAGTR